MHSHAPQGELFDQTTGLPSGLVYRAGFLDATEEQRLIEAIRELPLAEARYREYTARRRTAAFGLDYDFGSGALGPAPSLPPFLMALRARVAAWAGIRDGQFTQALVSEYRPGTALGWHRDVPEFGTIVGVSLGSACRMRLRPYPPRTGGGAFSLELQPRSAYALQGDARWGWQHAIAPTPGLRWSITFRTRSDAASRNASRASRPAPAATRSPR